MNFNVPTSHRLFEQEAPNLELNADPADFVYSLPRPLSGDGDTRVVLTPADGEQIKLDYQRNLLTGTYHVTALDDRNLTAVVADLEDTLRGTIDRGCWMLKYRKKVPYLAINDYLVLAELRLEVVPDENL